ncbi:MAG: ATP-dependent DNA helicase [Burkholderiaceae bacterium]|nr:ATP-dependent DNA helicase [Burkholderiaceae bacterium]
MSALNDVFGRGGAFARSLPNYRERTGQVELAQAIESTIDKRSVLVAEAGTGIGKTWAYLVPAVLSGAKVLVSTGTRTLQDQLFQKDLPTVRDVLAVPLGIAMLKGRANYLCHYYLQRLQDDPQALMSRGEVIWLRQIKQFAQTSKTGDRSELSSVPEDADIWNRVTSTRENCLAQDCPNVQECFVYKARRQAQDADLVVINHALYMADAALREQGISDLLPQADVVVFDEAHQLPAVATRFLGQMLSSAQLVDLAKQAEAAGLAHAREVVRWSELASGLSQAVKDWRLGLEWVQQRANRRAVPRDVVEQDNGVPLMQHVADALTKLRQALDVNAERHLDLAALARTAETLSDRLLNWIGACQSQASDLTQVYWLETTTGGVRLNVAPLSIASAFSAERQAGQAWIFVSATLSVKGDFSHFVQRLGLNAPQTHRQASPFEYGEQALLCVPKHLPAVQSPQYTAEFVGWLWPLIHACRGNAMILCTTLRAVENTANALRELYENEGVDWPILQQGLQPRRTLLDAFRQQAHAVLVGSASFWEGVDVVGQRLSLVAIDKLPFAPPDDPILEARLQACRDEGGNPFIELQVPEAAIALKQGAGRLIRSERDWGVLVVGDTRLVDKPYGRALWQGLPPFKRTRDQADALTFISQKQQVAIES